MANEELSTLGATIKTAYEAESNTNAYTDAEKTLVSTALQPGDEKFSRSVNTGTAITADATLDQTIQLLTGASAVTVTLSQTAGTNTQIVLVKNTAQVVTIQVTGAAVYQLPGDATATTRTAAFHLAGDVLLIGNAATWMVIGSTDITVIWQADVDANSHQLYGSLSPLQTATGSMAAAASARTWSITGNVTAVPVTNGWWAKIINKTGGSSRTITPASGTCVKTKDGTTGASVTIAVGTACVLQGDGTNLYIDGPVT